MDYRVEITDSARRDLDTILQAISLDLHSPSAASNLSDSYASALSLMGSTPHLHRVDESLSADWDLEIRRWPLKKFAIYYVVDDCEQALTIIAIAHSKKDPSTLLENRL